MVVTYCDLCGCKSLLSRFIAFGNTGVNPRFEICESCHKDILAYFKDIYMNMKEEKK